MRNLMTSAAPSGWKNAVKSGAINGKAVRGRAVGESTMTYVDRCVKYACKHKQLLCNEIRRCWYETSYEASQFWRYTAPSSTQLLTSV